MLVWEKVLQGCLVQTGETLEHDCPNCAARQQPSRLQATQGLGKHVSFRSCPTIEFPEQIPGPKAQLKEHSWS